VVGEAVTAGDAVAAGDAVFEGDAVAAGDAVLDGEAVLVGDAVVEGDESPHEIAATTTRHRATATRTVRPARRSTLLRSIIAPPSLARQPYVDVAHGAV
jgi:hypothetical protein